ncbi:katanin-interacting protein-like isoform X2 [Liolophura sinensis]|uniref:katanin-interacting protein-like isoform X2 n=1 Tax=Liolophura sinensis TaxID=3198878 RepID=UPI003158FD75
MVLKIGSGATRMSYSKEGNLERIMSDSSMAAQIAKEEIMPNYEEYLMLLQEKNRLVKKLKEKDKKQIVLEKREKGFSLYVNGANARCKPRPKVNQISPNQYRPKTRQAKTAGDQPRLLGINPADLYLIQQEEAKQNASRERVKTAPIKGRRNWAVRSIDIQTARGVKERLKAPRELTGNYEDDFESDGSEEGSERSEVVRSMAVSLDGEIDSEEEIQIDAGKFTSHPERKLNKRQPMTNKKRFKSKYLRRKAEIENNNNNHCDDGEDGDQLIMNLTDVRKLRQSLERNASIRRSLAHEVSSSSLPKLSPASGHNCATYGRFRPQESEEESAIAEEPEEEIEEDLTPAMGSLKLSAEENLLKPGDTIVLELATSHNMKVQKNLSVARKPLVDELDTSRLQNHMKTPVVEALPTQTGDQELKGKSLRKVSRPLSGCKKSSRGENVKQDTQSEAQAVLEALRAENSRVSQYSQGRADTPRQHTQNEDRDTGELPLSARERRRLKTPRSPQCGSSAQFPVPLPPDGPEATPTQTLPLKASPSQSVASQNCNHSLLTDDQLSRITDQISAMKPRQQKSLVKMLGKLEQSLSHSTQTTSPSRSSTSVITPTQHSPKELRLEILSTWGDPDRVGLTEIQLFDPQGQLISVPPDQLSAQGVSGSRGQLSCLVNNKCKTNKERNMWSCKYGGNSCVSICVKLSHAHTGQGLEVSKIKIWNYNKSINDLSTGVRGCRVFLEEQLVFEGELEKGCGNQVFDYSTTIPVTSRPSPLASRHESPLGTNPNTISNNHIHDNSVGLSTKPEHHSQRASPKPVTSPNIPLLPKTTRRSISPSPNRENKRTFPRFRDSPSSSGSSSGEVKISTKVASPCVSQEDLTQRSKTRTLNHSSDGTPLHRPVVTSQPSSPESDHCQQDQLKCRRGSGSKSPRKSKRMAAKLTGHVSSELEGSKSYLDSLDARPPRPPDCKAEDRARCPSVQDIPRPKASEDSLFAVPKLGQLPKSEDDDAQSVPSWLRKEEIDDYFDNPPGNCRVSRVGVAHPPSQSRQELLDWDDEISADWPTPGVDHLSTVFDDGLTETKPKSPLIAEASEVLDECTPMQRIQKNRARWRDNQQKKLEESWGSLNLFNHSHRGRLSIDMTDDVLDEYLVPSKKSSAKPAKATPKAPEPALDEEDFMIPELPYGRNLEINIQTTWGDKHYVGLTGIEIFSHTGDPVQVSKIIADPLDINVLPGYGKDPRVVANLVDGVNRTRDDIHMWLAPFTSSRNHYIHVTFEKPCRVAMIRVWNYNKSRIHSYRGAKDVVMKLDGCVIFKGEIARACGGIEGGTEAFGDTILFSVDEGILEAVSKHDSAFEGNGFSDDDVEDDVPFERPPTADSGKDERPFTRASGLLKPTKSEEETTRPQTSMVTMEGNVLVYKGQKLELNFTSTWGDLHYLGLTGLEVVGKDGEALPVTLRKLKAKPQDVRSLPGHEDDDRTLDKLIDGTNITVSDEHMWLIPFTDGHNHTLTVDFGQKVLIAGLRIWNYNKSPEDTYRGAKIVHVKVDGRLVSPPDGYLIRKGPGNCYFDYAQEISFSPEQKTDTSQQSSSVPASLSPGSSVDVPSQEYEAVQMPCGFIYQFHLLSTWGDPYYIGLNGLEFYDGQFNHIPLAENNIAAYPDSVNVLDNVKNDVRTPDKLIDGWNDSMDGRHMWIAPVLPHVVNRVYVIFDQPTTVSMIKLWNYSKTPNRGTKDFALLVDDLLVYNGVLNSVGQAARGILPNCTTQSYHTILFSDNKELLRKERHTVISKQEGEQDIQMLNDKKVVTHYSDPKKAQANKPVNQALRPKTSVPALNKRR